MKIYKNTVSNLLWEVLLQLMTFEELKSFRLIGGTSLSLMLGHRMSVDIDLFTDAEYDSIDFEIIDQKILSSFRYVEFGSGGNRSMGKSYYVGNSKTDLVKLDLFYTDHFQFPIVEYHGIRLSSLEEIVAMKLEVIGNSGRKKDFWDLHELMDIFSWPVMFEVYQKRYPYSYSEEELRAKLRDFEKADSDFDPICLKNKYWELIKLDITESIGLSF